VRPKLVWTYGSHASRFFVRATGRDDFHSEVRPASWRGHRFRLIGTPHLSRMSFERTRALAEELKALLDKDALSIP
jgi:hypothetical protein